MLDSHVIKHEQCPQCRELGKDKSNDNLAIYSDGHSWCFSCGYLLTASGHARIKNKIASERQGETTKEAEMLPTLFLPEDITTDYPQRALDWINQYDLSKNTLLSVNAVWSDSLQRLIFPIYDGNRSLIGWQGRDFILERTDKRRAKWFGRGPLESIFNILGQGNRLALTEDVVSAIKLSLAGIMAIPLYGCVVGRKRFKRLYSLYGDTVEVLVWLDPDKQQESIKEARLGRLCGLNCRAILSDQDPKEHSYEEITKYLQT